MKIYDRAMLDLEEAGTEIIRFLSAVAEAESKALIPEIEVAIALVMKDPAVLATPAGAMAVFVSAWIALAPKLATTAWQTAIMALSAAVQKAESDFTAPKPSVHVQP